MYVICFNFIQPIFFFFLKKSLILRNNKNIRKMEFGKKYSKCLQG